MVSRNTILVPGWSLHNQVISVGGQVALIRMQTNGTWLFLMRLASSPAAIKNSLERHRKRLESKLREEKLIQKGINFSGDAISETSIFATSISPPNGFPKKNSSLKLMRRRRSRSSMRKPIGIRTASIMIYRSS